MSKVSYQHFIVVILLTCCLQSCAESKFLSLQPSKYLLVWSDEFNYTGLPDSTKWRYNEGDGCPDLCGWGNNELQYYSIENLNNCRVENGSLTIEAHKQNIANQFYTSARLLSKGKASWKYGKIEIRAKIPIGLGLWPAFWMMPDDMYYGGWPKSGEIDIAENVGYMPDSLFGSVHTAKAHLSKGIQTKNLGTEFNLYAIEWNTEKIDFFFNNDKYATYKNSRRGSDYWPFDKNFHFIMNIAVGGNWGGKKGVDENVFPAKMLVDYVRVYQTAI